MEAVGASRALYGRLEDTLLLVREMCAEEVESVFLANIVTGDGQSQFPSAWFFTKNYALESKRFNASETAFNLDMVSLADGIAYWELDTESYNLVTGPTAASRLTFTFMMGVALGNGGRLQAAGTNCAYLAQIIRKYFHIPVSQRTA